MCDFALMLIALCASKSVSILQDRFDAARDKYSFVGITRECADLIRPEIRRNENINAYTFHYTKGLATVTFLYNKN